MKHNVNLIRVHVEAAWLCDMKDAEKEFFKAHPEKQITEYTYRLEWDKPLEWKKLFGVEEDVSWSDYIKDEQNHPKVLALGYYDSCTCEMGEKEYLDWVMKGLKMSIHGTRTVAVNVDMSAIGDESHSRALDFMNQLIDLQAKATKQLTAASEVLFNEKVQCVQPSIPVMAVNKLMLCEDSCTDVLQGYLDDGWRIMAIQPQPDQRRPDYILGKYEPTHRPDGRGAERG